MNSEALAGRVSIVTGGASGIGEAVARRFAREGARVLVADVDAKRGARLAEEIAAVEFLETDVSSLPACQALVEAALERFGRLDVLVNNAFWSRARRVYKLEPEDWRRTLEVTLDAVFYGMRAALPVLVEREGGCIVNTASISGLGADDGMSAYNAAKAGVVNLTRTAALEVAHKGVRVNCVCPGSFRSAIHEELPDAALDAIAARHPLGMGSAADLVGAYSYLASDASRWTTGSAIVVDGGYAAP